MMSARRLRHRARIPARARDGVPRVAAGSSSSRRSTSPSATIPTDKSYQVLATWRGMSGIKDILFTPNGQLFLLFGSGPRIAGPFVQSGRLGRKPGAHEH